MTRIYLILVVVLFLLWKVIFVNQKRFTKTLRRNTTKQAVVYERVDKRLAHQEHINVMEDMDMYKRWRLISDAQLASMKKDLSTLGIYDVEGYAHKSIKNGVNYILVGAAGVAGSVIVDIVLRWLLKVDLGFVISILKAMGMITLITGLICVFGIKFVIAKNLKEHVASIEKDLNKLFFHMYPYYSEVRTANYRLSDILSKFSTTNPQMEILVSTMINDSKRSEELALQSVIEGYSSSIKVVELASKILKCITGNNLGPRYLKSMYDQLIAEEDRARQDKETKKYDLYLMVMMITLIITMLIQVAGMMIEMY